MTWNNQYEFPQAIVHVDGDAFFASCEQSLHPEFKGKPVVVGQDRGIAASMSYEAKRKGVTRAMPIHKIREICPDVIILPSDYETYGLFSKRMFSIMRRYSSQIEESGIDEGFVDITGMQGALHMDYASIAASIKHDIQRELGITVSLGLAPTKVLSKVAARYGKPDGLTIVPTSEIEKFLKKLSVGFVWGIGPNTAQYMNKLGIQTAYEFISKTPEYIEQYFTKPHQEIYRELRGQTVYGVVPEQKNSYASISKTRTFTPATNDRDMVYAQLIKNVENACIKARRYHLATRKVSIFLKQNDFSIRALEVCVSRATAFPQDLIPAIKPLFDQLYEKRTKYRATGVVLADLQEDMAVQASLFENPLILTNMKKVYGAVDLLAKKFGKHTVHTVASLKAQRLAQHSGDRGVSALRKSLKLKGEWGRKRLNILTFFGMVR